MLERVLISARRAGTWRTTVHTTSLFSVHGRRPARLARARSGAAPQACQHRPGVTAMMIWFEHMQWYGFQGNFLLCTGLFFKS
jgi:hypothetical protein